MIKIFLFFCRLLYFTKKNHFCPNLKKIYFLIFYICIYFKLEIGEFTLQLQTLVLFCVRDYIGVLKVAHDPLEGRSLRV